MSELPPWLSDPALESTWWQLRARIERDGLVATGRLRLRLSSRAERHAVGGLVGVIVTGEHLTVDLADLDERLRQRSGCGGLVDVLARLGPPLRDRPAERVQRAAHRTEPLELARTLVDQAWAARWVDDLRRTGLLTRASDPTLVVRQAVAALDIILHEEPVGRSRVELSAQVLGDAHALDEDRLVHRVLVRALAAAADVDLPETAEQRWALWELFGVSPDLVSATCLTLGLRVDGDDAVSRRLGNAADSGDPYHLTRWDLRRFTGRIVPGAAVLVCENPRVLEGVAERHPETVAVVCTSGQPNTVVIGLLRMLAAAGATLHSHGDFDWAGIGIVNRLVADFGAVPWRLAAADYEDHARVDAPPLVGSPVEAAWDPDLAASMRAFGRSLHEESVLPVLVDHLGEIR